VGAMLKKYDNIIYNEKIKNKIACPWLNNEVIQRLGYKTSDEIVYLDEVTVYPARYFDPYPSGTGSNLLCDDTVSIHHYSASWTSGKQRFKRKLARIIGEDKILFVKKMIKKN
ncbi:MAG: hypothetical protein IJZ64_03750, partial [Ruminococcus sp.]|nr:hypothetical protein [Ruminococcus sp.]